MREALNADAEPDTPRAVVADEDDDSWLDPPDLLPR
jgi:hypothetical protein